MICVVEGEKDVHALEKLGKVATCNPGGAGTGKWRPEFSEMLRNARVAVIADRDDTGRAHAKAIVESLKGIARAVKILEPAKGKDVSDHLAAGLPLKALVCPNGRPRLEVLSCRDFIALPDPDVSGNLLGPLIYRGHRLVLGGHTGHGKSTIVTRMVAAAAYGHSFLGLAGPGRSAGACDRRGARTEERQAMHP